MATNWPIVHLEPFCEKIGSGATPRGGSKVYLEQGEISLIRSQNIYNDRFEPGGLVYIENVAAKALDNVEVQENDILLNITGDSVARVCIAPISVLPARVNQHVAIIRPSASEFDPRFLRYYLASSQTQSILLSLASSGATRNALTKGMIEKFEVPKPAIVIQERIANILSTLDDKIELNRRMNRTLEAMAQAIFKSWFVDFEPVKAKATAKAAGASPEEIERAAMAAVVGKTEAELDQLPKAQKQPLAKTASLFPDAFQPSELGEIPKGWRVEPLGDWIDVLQTGRRPKGGVSKYTSGVPSVGAESIRGIGGFEYSKTKFVPQEFFDSMKSGKVEDYDVLLYKDGGKPGDFKPRVGMLGRGFPFKEFGINEHVFRITSKSLGQPFLYFQVSSERILFDLANRGGKAAIPGINQTDVKTLDTLIPDEKVLKEFNKHCFEMIEAILSNCTQSETLAQLRDTLLPKMLSGESQLVGN